MSKSDMLSTDEIFTVIYSKVLANNRSCLVSHHIDSFNRLIEEQIPDNILKNNPIVVNVPLMDDVEDNLAPLVKGIKKKVSEQEEGAPLEGGASQSAVKFYRLKIFLEDIHYENPNHLETGGFHEPVEPLEARERNLNYMITYYVRIRAEVFAVISDKFEKKLFDIKIKEKNEYCSIPCMVLSKACNLRGLTPQELTLKGEDYFERGGYFIMKGEKILVPQESQQYNHPMLFENKNNIKAYRERELTKKKLNKTIKLRQRVKIKETYLYTCSVSSKMDHQRHAVPYDVFVGYNEDGHIWVHIQNGYIEKGIPLHVLFYALGATSDREILEYCVNDFENTNVLNIMLESMKLKVQFSKSVDRIEYIRDQRSALEYIVEHFNKKMTEKTAGKDMDEKTGIAIDNIRRNLFPHLGDDFITKMHYLGYMTNELLKLIVGQTKPTERDNFSFKRIDLAGALILSIFNYNRAQAAKGINSIVQNAIKKNYQEISESSLTDILAKLVIKPNDISAGVKRSFKTGNWVDNPNTMSQKKGVTMLMNRKSPLETVSATRKVVTPVIGAQSSKTPDRRRLAPSQFMMICPYETPEGASTGLVKNLSILCHVSIGMKDDVILERVLDFDYVIRVNNIMPSEIKDYTKVFVNGNYIAVTKKAEKLVKILRSLRREGKIYYEVSIVRDYIADQVRIYTDPGRAMVPLFIVRDNKLVISKRDIENLKKGTSTWNTLLIEGKIEYLDTQELQSCVLLAQTQVDLQKADPELTQYTHCILHPSGQLGASASIIPFSNHNPGPRNLFQSSMGKQAMSIYVANFNARRDTNASVLFYPQVPIVNTRNMDMIGLNESPTGRNAIVAIICYSGYNQEDSVIGNETSFRRGLYRCISYKTTVTECSNTDEFRRPDPTTTKGYNLKLNYKLLNADGIVPPGTVVRKDDILIGKVANMDKNDKSEWRYRDLSAESRCKEEYAVVDRTLVDENQEGQQFNKTTLRIDRIPIVGDKFSSRSGQKGTLGITYRREDMPYTESGMTPDIIMNPHAHPKRMTIPHLIEQLQCKLSVHHGVIADGTPYNETDVHDIVERLAEDGLPEDGKETMYCGFTGEKFEARICIGPTFYQRLKHLVSDKIHCSQKDHQILTKQGWYPISEVNEEMEIATLNQETYSLEYQKPTKVHKYENFEGELYELKSQQVELTVTTNHRMFVSKCYGRKREWLSHTFEFAGDIIGKHRKYKKDAVWSAEDYQFILPEYTDGNNVTYEEYAVPMDAWLTFFGIWYAEGCVPSGKKNITNICHIKQRVKDVLYPAVEELEFKFNEYNVKTKNGMIVGSFDIRDEQLTNYMRPLSVGAVNKTLPNWVWELSSRQAYKLMYAMILGDGCFKKSNTNDFWYYTASVKLADDFQRLALHAGYSGNISVHIPAGTPAKKYDGEIITNNHDVLRISVVKTKNTPAVNHGHCNTQNGQSERIYRSKEPVYCVSVPNQIFYIRKNGKPCWTGNSRFKGPYQLLTRQPLEGRAKNGGPRVGEMETWSLISHGLSLTMKERFMECSDKAKFYVCNMCGLLASANKMENIYECKNCNNMTNISPIEIPYASKVFLQMLYAMGIAPRIIVESDD